MVDDQKMLEYITETADMGKDALTQVMGQTEDSNLKEVLRTQRTEYEENYQAARDLLEKCNCDVKNANPIAKTNARITSTMKTLVSEDTTSKIAEMVIQGSTMGVTTMTKHLNEYTGDNKEVKSLAQKHIKTEQANIDQMKKFL